MTDIRLKLAPAPALRLAVKVGFPGSLEAGQGIRVTLNGTVYTVETSDELAAIDALVATGIVRRTAPDTYTAGDVVSVAEGGTGQTTEAEAIGEMTQALTEDTAPDWSADYVPTYDASADTGKKAKLSTLTRERLQASRSYYVGYVVGNPAISIASPAVVTLTSHGLQANDPVIFSALENKRTCTVTAANPGVFTLTGHGFSAGQPVQFPTTGNLPGGLSQTTTYYVISAGLTANDFEISATVGGAAINTSLLTATFTNGNSSIAISANHNLAVGQIIQFSGTSVVNISNATDYRVKSVVDATHITVSLKSDNTDATVTPGVVTTNGSLAATGTHYCAMVGALPTGVTAGTTYYVISAGLTANAFEFSTSAGGAAVNTSGSVTGSPVYTLTTGNDSNDGKSLARAGAWLTIQKAINVVSGELDLNTFTATINVAKGTYSGALTLKPLVGRGAAVITGDTTSPSNCVITATSATCITCAVGGWDMRGFKTLPVTAGNHIKGSGGECSLFVRNWEFGAAPAGWYHTTVDANGFIQILSGCTISGGAQAHWSAQNGGRLQASSQTINVVGVPSFSSAFAEVTRTASILVPSDTLNGGAAGTRYTVTLNGVIDTFAAGSTYPPGNSAGSSATGGQYA